MAINSVRISGNLVCDYLWFLNRHLTSDERNVISDRNNEPSWTLNTELLVTFNDSLFAGNITNGNSKPTSWRVYRRNVDDGTMELAAITNNNATSIVDYNVVNGKTYEYVLFAETEGYITAPITSPQIKTAWTNFCLFDVDEQPDGTLKMHRCFVFDFNANSGTMTNGLSATAHTNFTKYPKFIKSNSNYYASTLTGLLGYIDENGDYFDSADMLDSLSEFTTDTRLKFLKDRRGHIWRVEVSAPLSVTAWDNFGGVDPYSVSIPWTECGSASGLIINR